jgi:hypothetical protein
MHAKQRILTIVLCLWPVSLSFGQTPANPPMVHSFHFANPQSARGFQEIATMLRTVGNIQHLSLDANSSSLAVSGTASEINLADWLIHELDQPSPRLPADGQTGDNSTHQFAIPEAKDDVVQMFYLSHCDTPQSVQELLTVIRTVGNVQKTFNNTAVNSIAVRETADRLAMVAWIIHELDQASGSITPGVHEFRSSDQWTPVMRVFYLANNRTTKNLQETLTALRTKTFIRYAFNSSRLSAIIVGGTPAEIEQAAVLVDQMDRPQAN